MPSTVIDNISYDAATATLTIRFVSGAVYDYLQVPEATYLALKSYREKGVYLNQHIKGQYAFKKRETP
jgi:hypothetical protein